MKFNWLAGGTISVVIGLLSYVPLAILTGPAYGLGLALVVASIGAMVLPERGRLLSLLLAWLVIATAIAIFAAGTAGLR